jgi:hypothetical protein
MASKTRQHKFRHLDFILKLSLLSSVSLRTRVFRRKYEQIDIKQYNNEL